MKFSVLFTTSLLLTTLTHAQTPNDTWSNVPPARDDRYTNPKSKIYAGPNGWFNFGELRAGVSNAAKTSYGFKGGFRYVSTPRSFIAVGTNNLQTLQLDFGTEHPGVGVYKLSSKANPAQKKVFVSFSDVSGEKLREWASTDQAGTVAVTLVNGFLYFKCRNVPLQPVGIHNTGDFKQPMTLGFEGAIAPE